ncbi:MAG: hypothetical protein HUU32_20025 [Calditrichaceae bacterium]|nr:hypothetical protein [Calditrichia bacterium]NUQ43686.1 hypothetical protein [Calditrichaceae bacterium]
MKQGKWIGGMTNILFVTKLDLPGLASVLLLHRCQKTWQVWPGQLAEGFGEA